VEDAAAPAEEAAAPADGATAGPEARAASAAPPPSQPVESATANATTELALAEPGVGPEEAPAGAAAPAEPVYEVNADGGLVVDGVVLVRATPVGDPPVTPGPEEPRRRRKISIPVDVNSLLTGDLSQDVPLRHRDIIYVPGGQAEVTSGIVYVLGPGVMRAGPQQIPLGMKYTAGLAVTQAGVGRFANLGRAVLKRIDAQTGEIREERLNLDRVLNKGDVQKDVAVQDGDVIFVPDKFLSL